MPNHSRSPLNLLKIIFSFYLSLLIFNIKFISPVYANTIATNSAQISATIPSLSSPSNLAPTPPILVRPTNASITANPTPEFVWQQSSDPDGNTITYTLYLDGVATFLGISNTGNSAHSNYTTTIVGKEIRLIPTQPLSEGVHQWLVRASDPAGNYQNSTTWNLTIDTIPPTFTITDIDTYHQLQLDSNHPENITSSTNFDLTGPKDIYFTIKTEPHTTIQLSFYDQNNLFIGQTSGTTNSNSNILYLYQHLEVGQYTIKALAIDSAILTTNLPDFSLTITQPKINLFLTPNSRKPIISIPYTPTAIPTLPATISNVNTREHIAFAIIALLALTIYLLLIILKKQKFNLILLDSKGQPITQATLYHSIPDSTPQQHRLHTPSFLTHHNPLRHQLTQVNKGKIYIHHLNRYSTLTISIPSSSTNKLNSPSLTILSISNFHSPLTLIIDYFVRGLSL